MIFSTLCFLAGVAVGAFALNTFEKAHSGQSLPSVHDAIQKVADLLKRSKP